MNPIRIHAIARKEFYHLIRDFRSLYLAFFIPLLLILLFGYALSLDLKNVKIAVVDQDNTELSRDIVEKLNTSFYFDVTAHLPNSKALEKYLDHGRTSMGLVIPPDWTENLKADRESSLQIILDGSDPNLSGLTRSYLTAFIEDDNHVQRIDFFNRKGMEKMETAVEGRIRVWFNEDLESRNFIVPGLIAVIIMIVGAMLTSLVIAREYENGTMETICALPIQADEFILGKAIPYFFIGLIDVLMAVLVGQFLFGVVMKSSFWLLMIAASIYLAVALNLGLFISVVAKSQLVANQVAILVTYLPSLLLSNFVFPVENMPAILQKITYIVPATYFINILNGLYMRGSELGHLWSDYLILLIMFGILFIVNLVILKKEGL
ncbi:MAG: ABC transporter permease [Desulfobacterales bacterium]|nr:ABC transporter permease [Desulfobacterales bacterium]